MFNFLKKFFNFNNCHCNKCNCTELKELNTIISRKDYKIVLPVDIYNVLKENKLSISATKYKGKTSCVQMFETINGKSKYKGTLKTYMNVKSFIDGNVCNFSRDNLIYKGEK